MILYLLFLCKLVSCHSCKHLFSLKQIVSQLCQLLYTSIFAHFRQFRCYATWSGIFFIVYEILCFRNYFYRHFFKVFYFLQHTILHFLHLSAFLHTPSRFPSYLPNSRLYFYLFHKCMAFQQYLSCFSYSVLTFRANI